MPSVLSHAYRALEQLGQTIDITDVVGIKARDSLLQVKNAAHDIHAEWDKGGAKYKKSNHENAQDRMVKALADAIPKVEQDYRRAEGDPDLQSRIRGTLLYHVGLAMDALEIGRGTTVGKELQRTANSHNLAFINPSLDPETSLSNVLDMYLGDKNLLQFVQQMTEERQAARASARQERLDAKGEQILATLEEKMGRSQAHAVAYFLQAIDAHNQGNATLSDGVLDRMAERIAGEYGLQTANGVELVNQQYALIEQVAGKINMDKSVAYDADARLTQHATQV